jgi:hypothetical protein
MWPSVNDIRMFAAFHSESESSEVPPIFSQFVTCFLWNKHSGFHVLLFVLADIASCNLVSRSPNVKPVHPLLCLSWTDIIYYLTSAVTFSP